MGGKHANSYCHRMHRQATRHRACFCLEPVSSLNRKVLHLHAQFCCGEHDDSKWTSRLGHTFPKLLLLRFQLLDDGNQVSQSLPAASMVGYDSVLKLRIAESLRACQIQPKTAVTYCRSCT